MPKLRLAAAAAVVASACSMAAPPAAQDIVVYQGGGGGGDDGCSRAECGGSGNSPVMDGVYFWSLNFDGKPNNQGFWLVSAEKAGIPVWLRLGEPGDRWRAIVKADPAVVFEHAALREVTFTVQRGAKLFQIRIAEIYPDQEAFWAVPTTKDPGKVESYELAFTPLNDPDLPHEEHWLCSHPIDEPGALTAIVFGGDIYDADTKRIAVGSDAAGWFNIACYKGAPWKMHMIGHTGVANTRLGITTSVDKRRAMLNAWTMNACGTGRPFTHPGEPITLEERPDVLPVDDDYRQMPVSHEAVWGPRGALCLDTPRLTEEDSEILEKIKDECRGEPPPPCGATWPRGGEVSTGNPPEPEPELAAAAARSLNAVSPPLPSHRAI